ncbi:uncharacterized protein LOC126743299 [Anthonomus grandis grandis]|uniref:uncharacterized protein LOC126743299 n=1 Tax=Anthonomus grandis grandis TaxID=2921223 RepID=UPI002166520F|nr:uncharacterized protein LOC126743299 [Anthonomus grandis grandis]
MTSAIASLLNIFFATYFFNSRCVVLVSDDMKDLDISNAKAPLLLINSDDHNNFTSLFNYSGCQDFVVFAKDPVSLLQVIEEQIQAHQDRFNERGYVFLPKEDPVEDSLKIFNLEEISYISDLVVVTFDEISLNEQHKSFNIWTHQYIGQGENNKPLLMDKWFSVNKSFLYERNLFPDKLTDQKGRVIKLAVFNYEPYVIIEEQGNGSYFYMGSEMLTMVHFAHHHNCTVQPVINEGYWGDIFENGSGIGLLGNLVDDRADIGAAALYTWGFAYKALDLSKPMVRTGITCLVPAPKLAAGWLTPFYVYAPQTWLAVIATFLLSLITIYSLDIFQISIYSRRPKSLDASTKVKVFGKALISVSKPFIMQNVTEKEITKGLMGRYLMGLVFITTLVLSTTYDSGLSTIMTIPKYENSIDTVDDLVKSGLDWGGTSDAWIKSIEDSEEPNMIKLVSRFMAKSEEHLRRLSFTGKFALSIERLPKDNFAVGSYIQEDTIKNFHLMTEDLYWEQCVIMMRKSSILLPYVDMFVLRAFEAGLISFWQNEAATQYMDPYVQKAVKYFEHHQQERGIIKLKMLHVQGAFGILVLGNFIALLTFIGEHCYYRFFNQWFSHNKSFLLKNNLYYNKIQQQDGKKILVGVFDYRPYIIIDKDIASGLEIHLLREIVRYMNATLELVVQEDLWGLVHPNKTGYGLRGNLYFDKLDIGAAGLFMTYSASEHFDQSRGYANAELTCLVPAPRLAAAWLSPTYSFSPHLWFLLFLTYVTLIVIVYALNHYQMSIKKHNISRFISKTTILISSIESVCKPLLGHNFSRKKYYFKPLMGLVLLSTLIVCTAYVAGFASVLTKPIYETSINTMEDFLSSDISWGGVQTADYIMSWASSEQELYRKAAERYVATTPAHLEYIFRHNRNFAFKVERVNGQYHIDSYIHEQSMKYYMTMKDPIQTQYVVLIFRKNSILLPVANRIIERLVDSGIILYWTNEYSGHQDYVMKKKLQYAHVRRNNENVAITLSHVVSAFFIIGFDHSSKFNYSGSDIRLLEEFANRLNATLEIKMCNSEFWGYVYRNGTTGGLRGKLYHDDIDIAAAGFFVSYVHKFDITAQYHLTEVKCLLPAPSLIIPWFTPFAGILLWSICLISFTCIALTTILVFCVEKNIIKKKFKISTTTLRNGIVFTSFATTFKPLLRQTIRSNSIINRALMKLVLLSTILILESYNAVYISALTKRNYEKSIDTFEDFLNSDVKWAAVHGGAWVDQWRNSKCVKLQNAANRFVKANIEAMLKFSEEGKVGLAIDKLKAKKKHFQTMVLDGVEGTIINHFFGKFNLTWNPIWVKKEYWGDVFDNGSSYGLRGELFKDKIDLAIAANFMTDRMYRFYGMTVPILRVGITCLVPAPKPIPSWLTPWHVYSKLLWLVIILAYLLIVCAILCVYWTTESCTREDFRENGFYKRLSNIGETVFIVFTHHFTKNGILRGHTRNIFVTLTLFVTFFLSRCYESGLSSIMTIPSYGSSIETNHDFLESNISWGGIQVADWIMHWQTDKEERYRRAHRRYVAVSSQNVLKKLMAAGNFGLLIERISPDIFHFPFSNLENAKTLRLMKEDIQWEYTVIFLRKSAPLIPYLDKFLLELKEGGIIKYWLDEAAAKVLPRTAQKEVRRLSLHYEPVVEKLVQLKLVHVAGIFGIMAVGNLFAIVAFLLELIYYKRFS